MIYNPQLDTFLRMAAVRAKNAMQDSGNAVRIGTFPMTPGQFVLKLWPSIQEQCPNI